MQHIRRKARQQRFRQAEAQNQQFERSNSQQRQSLIQIGNVPRHPKQRTVDDAQDFCRQGRIVFDALLERLRVNLRVARQFQHLRSNRRQRV